MVGGLYFDIAIGADCQHRFERDVANEKFEDPDGGCVSPMQVLQDHEDRLHLCGGGNDAHERVAHLELCVFGGCAPRSLAE